MASAAALASSDTAGEETRTGSAGALRPTGRTPPRRPVPVLTEAELEAYELNIDGGGKLTSGVHAIQARSNRSPGSTNRRREDPSPSARRPSYESSPKGSPSITRHQLPEAAPAPEEDDHLRSAEKSYGRRGCCCAGWLETILGGIPLLALLFACGGAVFAQESKAVCAQLAFEMTRSQVCGPRPLARRPRYARPPPFSRGRIALFRCAAGRRFLSPAVVTTRETRAIW